MKGSVVQMVSPSIIEIPMVKKIPAVLLIADDRMDSKTFSHNYTSGEMPVPNGDSAEQLVLHVSRIWLPESYDLQKG